MPKRSKKPRIAHGIGTMQCTVGIILLAAFLLLALTGSIPLGADSYLFGVVALLAACVGASLFTRGIITRRLTRRLRTIQGLMTELSRISLSSAADRIGCSITSLVNDVRYMQLRGYRSGLYADLIRRDLVDRETALSAEPPQPPADGVVLREERRSSSAPLYWVGYFWLVWAVSLPLYRLLDFLLATIASMTVYYITRRRARERVVIFEQKALAPPKTGNELLDEMLRGAQSQMEQLRMLDRKITEGKVDAAAREILSTTERILERVRSHPDSAGQIRQFLSYTLPTTIDLLKSYEELSRQPSPGETVRQAIGRIEETMDSIVSAFHRQLDSLFRDKALNIEVELEVMKRMLEDTLPGGSEFRPGSSGDGSRSSRGDR